FALTCVRRRRTIIIWRLLLPLCYPSILVVLFFHPRHELDEFRRRSDAVQIRITPKQWVAGKSRSSSFRQPFNRLLTVTLECIDTRYVISCMMIFGISRRKLTENARDLALG